MHGIIAWSSGAAGFAWGLLVFGCCQSAAVLWRPDNISRRPLSHACLWTPKLGGREACCKPSLAAHHLLGGGDSVHAYPGGSAALAQQDKQPAPDEGLQPSTPGYCRG